MLKIARVLFLTLTVLLFACTQEEIVTGDNAKMGKLVLGNVEVSAQVGDMQSRATLDASILPAGTEFSITVKSEDGSFNQTLEQGAVSCILPVGTYTVEAAYGEDVISTDTPYFYGEAKSVEITENTATSVTVEASLQSAIIRPVMSDKLLAQYSEYNLNVTGDGGVFTTVENEQDVFVPAGEEYYLHLSGENKLGEEVEHTWDLTDLNPGTRYIISCDADLPSFTLPEQSETNAWSKFIYITPMTAENMTSHKEDMWEKVEKNIVYEASADGSTWLPAQYDSDKGKWVIKNLNPNTTYTLRSRFGAVLSSNTQEVTTENAQQLVNGEMDQWANDEYTTYGMETIYRYYVGNSSSDRCWGTRNTLTMDGVKDGNSGGTSNQRTAYRWNSSTIPTDDAKSSQAAEIRTIALANFAINSGAANWWELWNRSRMAENVLNDATVYIGYLYTGKEDIMTTDEPNPNSYKIAQEARPLSLSFDYKYAPYNNDNFVVSAYLYDTAGNQIAHIGDYKSGEAQNAYVTKTLDFVYDNPLAKAGYIYVVFKSGEKNTVNDVQHIEGSYGANPWSLDTFVGSVLKIDNVKLNYDYE